MEPSKKATFVLPESMLTQVRALVDSGQAQSASAFVRESLERRLREIREEKLRAHFQQATQDAEFMADLEGTMREFAALDAESARMIP